MGIDDIIFFIFLNAPLSSTPHFYSFFPVNSINGLVTLAKSLINLL